MMRLLKSLLLTGAGLLGSHLSAASATLVYGVVYDSGTGTTLLPGSDGANVDFAATGGAIMLSAGGYYDYFGSSYLTTVTGSATSHNSSAVVGYHILSGGYSYELDFHLTRTASVAVTPPAKTVLNAGDKVSLAITGPANTTLNLSDYGSPLISLESGGVSITTIATDGSGNASIDVVAQADGTYLGSATGASVLISDPGSGASTSQAFTINDTAADTLDISLTGSITEGESATATVTLRHGASDTAIAMNSDVTVTIGVTGNGGVSTPASVIIPSGSSSTTFSVNTAGVEDAVDAANAGATISVSSAGYTGDSQAISIPDDDETPVLVGVNSTSIAEDGSTGGNLGSIMSDGDGDSLTYTLTDTVDHGSLGFTPATGVWSYTPTAEYNGSDSFSFTASDGANTSAVVTYTITITAQPDSPTIADGADSIAEDTPLSTTLPVASDPDSGETFTYAKLSDPSNGSVTVNTNGSFTYTPTANYSGTDTFTYQAVDSTARASNAATYTVTVTPVNDAPTVTGLASATLSEDGSTGGDLDSIVTDIDGDALTYTLTDDVDNGSLSFNGSTGIWNYTPTADFNGSDSFAFTISDGTTTTGATTFSLTVSAQPDSPSLTSGGGATNEDTALVSTLPAATDPDSGETFTYAKVSDPANGSVTVSSNGSFTYTPNSGYNGSDSFTFQATDSTAHTSNVATYSITVNAVNDGPSLTGSNSESIAEDGSTGGDLDTIITDGDGDAVTYSLVDNVDNGALSFDGATGVWSYTPTANWNGSDSFGFTATDGSLTTATITYTITVTAQPDSPSISDSSNAVNEDSVLIWSLPVATDPDNGETFTYAKVGDPTNGTVLINSDGGFSYQPDADFAGTDSFTFRAIDSTARASNTATYTVTVNPLPDSPSIVDDSSSTDEDTVLAANLPAATDLDSGETFTYAKVTDPANGSVTVNGDGSFSYTPTANFFGSDSFTYQAVDSTARVSNTATYTVTVTAVNDAPTITGSTSASLAEDTSTGGDLDSLVNDIDGDALTYAVTDDVDHGSLALDGLTGVWTYTPQGDFSGSDSFAFTISDGTTTTGATTFSLTVTAEPDSPSLSNGSASTDEDTALNSTLPTATDPDSGETFTYAKVSDPANGSVTVNSSGSFTYTPNGGFNGSDSFTFQASDSTARTSNVATYFVTVNPINDGPALTGSVTESIAEDGSTGGDLDNIVTDGDGDPVTYTLVDNVDNGALAFDGATGVWSYTPTANWNGSDSFGFTATDGTFTTGTITYTITVTAVADNPSIADGSASVNEDSSLSSSLPVATDPDSGETLSYAKVGEASNGAVTVNADGSFTYTPNADFAGTDSFSYKATDSTARDSNNATFTVTVNPLPDNPRVSDGAGSVAEDSALSESLPVATDPDSGETFTYAKVSDPANGSVTVNSNGSFTYTPIANFAGSDAFTFQAIDSTARTSTTATYTVTVTPQPDSPSIADGSASISEGGSLTTTLPVATDPDSGETFTYATVTNPTNGALSLNSNGAFTYTPSANFNGTDSFTYQAVDSETLSSNTATFTITVTSVNDQPVSSNDSAVVTEGQTVAINVLGNDSDPDGDILTVSEVGAASHGSVVNRGTDLTYTADAFADGFTGTDSFTYTASDGNGGSSSATVTVDIAGNRVIGIAVSDGAAASVTLVNGAGSQTGAQATDDSDADGKLEFPTESDGDDVYQGLDATMSFGTGNSG